MGDGIVRRGSREEFHYRRFTRERPLCTKSGRNWKSRQRGFTFPDCLLPRAGASSHPSSYGGARIHSNTKLNAFSTTPTSIPYPGYPSDLCVISHDPEFGSPLVRGSEGTTLGVHQQEKETKHQLVGLWKNWDLRTM